MDNRPEILIIANLFNPADILATAPWQPLVAGVRVAPIYTDTQTAQGPRAAFLHYAPGARVPNHRHLGYEHILILDGYQIDGEKQYNPGTLIIHSLGTEHSLQAPDGCIALGIWEKPVEFV